MSQFAIIAAEGKVIDPARSIHWLFPAEAELIYGTLASAIIFALLWKFAGPALKKALADRTERIQSELDAAEAAQTAATAEAAGIRQAGGDIDAERQRLFAEADAQAEVVLAEGRERLEVEVAELEARADADIAAAAARTGDELRQEIVRLSTTVTDRLIADGVLDDAAQHDLIERFIAEVGRSAGTAEGVTHV